MNCPTCGTDRCDYRNNDEAQCVSGHRWTQPDPDDIECGQQDEAGTEVAR